MRHAPQHGLAGPARCRHRPCPAMSHRPERPPSLPIYQHPELATHAPPACCPLMPQPEGAETNGSQQPAWASQLTAPPPLPRLAPPPLPHPTNQPMPVAMPSLAQQQSAIATLTTSVALHCHSCGAQLGRHAGQRGWHRPRCRCRCHPTCHGPSPPAATRPAHSPAICRTRMPQPAVATISAREQPPWAGWLAGSVHRCPATPPPPHRLPAQLRSALHSSSLPPSPPPAQAGLPPPCMPQSRGGGQRRHHVLGRHASDRGRHRCHPRCRRRHPSCQVPTPPTSNTAPAAHPQPCHAMASPSPMPRPEATPQPCHNRGRGQHIRPCPTSPPTHQLPCPAPSHSSCPSQPWPPWPPAAAPWRPWQPPGRA